MTAYKLKEGVVRGTALRLSMEAANNDLLKANYGNRKLTYESDTGKEDENRFPIVNISRVGKPGEAVEPVSSRFLRLLDNGETLHNMTR